jgi:pyridoxine kinase
MSWTLQLTHKLALQQYNQHSTSSKPLEGKINDLDTMKYFELRIIQSRKFFSFDGTGDFKSTNLK